MCRSNKTETGFTLIEIAIVLLIVGLLLGYTVALFPRQQELKQYRAADKEMDEIIEVIIGFAQVNGRLPCPAIPGGLGLENGGGTNNCGNYGGFLPANTLGITGRLNRDSLMLDPWGNPYRYYVSPSDVVPVTVGGVTAGGTADVHDFVRANEMRVVGLVDLINVAVGDFSGDTYIDLDGQFVICDQGDATLNQVCDLPASPVFGRAASDTGPFAGAPFVIVSHGKDWNQGAAAGDQLVNMGASLSNTDLFMGVGPTENEYLLKNVTATPAETTFVKRLAGQADDFDDIVKWVSPNTLFSKMIEADQLP
jgi:prepilin-type N-terminal cleavage/methylation domain-containing protein